MKLTHIVKQQLCVSSGLFAVCDTPIESIEASRDCNRTTTRNRVNSSYIP